MLETSESALLCFVLSNCQREEKRLTRAHRWYYKSGLGPEEVILIKCFDSKLDGRARRVPHTAFEIPGTEEKEGRESIEVRCLVFHEDDTPE